MLARLSGSFDEHRQLKFAGDLREVGNLRIPTTSGSMVRNVRIPMGERRASGVVLWRMDEIDAKLGAVLIKLVVIAKCPDSGYARKFKWRFIRSAAIEECPEIEVVDRDADRLRHYPKAIANYESVLRHRLSFGS